MWKLNVLLGITDKLNKLGTWKMESLSKLFMELWDIHHWAVGNHQIPWQVCWCSHHHLLSSPKLKQHVAVVPWYDGHIVLLYCCVTIINQV
jgi:hypothetical protein